MLKVQFMCRLWLVTLLVGTGANCPDRWVTFKRSCYLFSVDSMPFNEAEEFCRHHKGFLVEVNSQLENDFLRDYLTELKDADHWLGLTDKTSEGRWIWYKSKTGLTFIDWNPGEPGNGWSKDEDCVIFGYAIGFHWADVTCSSSRKPVCEKSNDVTELIG